MISVRDDLDPSRRVTLIWAPAGWPGVMRDFEYPKTGLRLFRVNESRGWMELAS